jgi:hypothetical protein
MKICEKIIINVANGYSSHGHFYYNMTIEDAMRNLWQEDPFHKLAPESDMVLPMFIEAHYEGKVGVLETTYCRVLMNVYFEKPSCSKSTIHWLLANLTDQRKKAVRDYPGGVFLQDRQVYGVVEARRRADRRMGITRKAA